VTMSGFRNVGAFSSCVQIIWCFLATIFVVVIVVRGW
jgi:hypothetical protein